MVAPYSLPSIQTGPLGSSANDPLTEDSILVIILNPNEANVLLNLIDLAVKSAGIHAAEAALHLTKLIQTAAKAEADHVAAAPTDVT
jgi:hypothetical protein